MCQRKENTFKIKLSSEAWADFMTIIIAFIYERVGALTAEDQNIQVFCYPRYLWLKFWPLRRHDSATKAIKIVSNASVPQSLAGVLIWKPGFNCSK